MATLKAFYHDNCFDGAASAAVFADFYRQQIDRGARVVLQGMQHQVGDPFAEQVLDGDDNACLDFRYCASDRMTWWFDHHASAFQPPDLRAHYEADTSGQKHYDPTARSCTKFAAELLRDRFAYEWSREFAELIEWADVIDGAQFPDAASAVELREPALQLMTWIEHNRNRERGHELIRALGHRSLADIAAAPFIHKTLAPLLEQHWRTIDLIRDRAVLADEIVYFDLLADGVGAHNKFISYYLFPGSRYTVSVTGCDRQVKISVGSNPWASRACGHDIASICERYGGGGHPVVGAITLRPGESERARRIAAAIREQLAE